MTDKRYLICRECHHTIKTTWRQVFNMSRECPKCGTWPMSNHAAKHPVEASAHNDRNG